MRISILRDPSCSLTMKNQSFGILAGSNTVLLRRVQGGQSTNSSLPLRTTRVSNTRCSHTRTTTQKKTKPKSNSSNNYLTRRGKARNSWLQCKDHINPNMKRNNTANPRIKRMICTKKQKPISQTMKSNKNKNNPNITNINCTTGTTTWNQPQQTKQPPNQTKCANLLSCCFPEHGLLWGTKDLLRKVNISKQKN